MGVANNDSTGARNPEGPPKPPSPSDVLDELRVRRLVLVDQHDQERLVAELIDNVLELRLDLPHQQAGSRTSLLLFAVPEQQEYCAGVGMQLWVDGDMVQEFAWWSDQPAETL